MKITFSENYKVQAKDGPEYKEGQAVDMEEGSAAHFVNKGVAEHSTKVQKKAQEEKAKKDKAAKKNK